MNKTIKVLTALGSATFALAFAVTAASAQTTNLVNTGEDAEIEVGSSFETEVEVENDNEAFVSQSSYSKVNTGDNESEGNIGGGSITSGNAAVMNTFSATANTNQTGLSFGGNTGADAATYNITNTGEDLEFEGGNDYDTEVEVENDNDSTTLQSSISKLNTGDNEAEGNVEGGDIVTGGALVSNDFTADTNTNGTLVAGLGTGGTGGGTLALINTGEDAEIEVGNEYDTEVEVENDSKAFVSQFTFASLNTGDNEAEGNVGGGDVESGNALASSLFSAMANNNGTGIDLAGLTDGESSDVNAINTGEDLEIEGGLSVETEVEVESENESYFYQSSVDDVETGDNESEGNVGGGNTGSGDAGLWADFMADANWNWTMVE